MAGTLHRNIEVTVDAGVVPGAVLRARSRLTYTGGAELDAESELAVAVVAETLPLSVKVEATPARASAVLSFSVMTPSEKNIVKSLVAVAWADGTVKEPEVGMIDSLLWAFGASEEDEGEVREFAKKKRTIKDDVPLDALAPSDRELLLAHAALLTHADGKQTKAEEKLLKDLADHLGIAGPDAKRIAEEARTRAEKLASKV